MYGSFDAQIVQFAVYIERLKVFVAQMMQHATVDHTFVENVLVLWQTDIVKPFFSNIQELVVSFFFVFSSFFLLESFILFQ